MIVRWSDGIADDNMAEDILVDLGSLIRKHPWWKARASLTLELLDRLGVRPPSRVLDAGCGWGTTLGWLERKGYKVVGADISRRALQELDRPGRELVEVDLTKPLPDGIDLFDAVLALDVIEHLDDDRAAVARLGEMAKPGGVVVVSVPALPDLFTEFDEIQGHRRRHLPEVLRAAFDGTGLDVERIFWWGSWMVPMLRRSRGKPRSKAGESTAETYRRYLSVPPWPGPLLLRGAFALEQKRTLEGKLTIGTSLFAVARRLAGDVPGDSLR
jgi:SAM-dependent methyltransferase